MAKPLLSTSHRPAVVCCDVPTGHPVPLPCTSSQGLHQVCLDEHAMYTCPSQEHLLQVELVCTQLHWYIRTYIVIVNVPAAVWLLLPALFTRTRLSSSSQGSVLNPTKHALDPPHQFNKAEKSSVIFFVHDCMSKNELVLMYVHWIATC